MPTGIWRGGPAVPRTARRRRRRRRRRTALIKSNNPHLAGGEKTKLTFGVRLVNRGKALTNYIYNIYIILYIVYIDIYIYIYYVYKYMLCTYVYNTICIYIYMPSRITM